MYLANVSLNINFLVIYQHFILFFLWDLIHHAALHDQVLEAVRLILILVLLFFHFLSVPLLLKLLLFLRPLPTLINYIISIYRSTFEPLCLDHLFFR